MDSPIVGALCVVLQCLGASMVSMSITHSILAVAERSEWIAPGIIEGLGLSLAKTGGANASHYAVLALMFGVLWLANFLDEKMAHFNQALAERAGVSIDLLKKTNDSYDFAIKNAGRSVEGKAFH